VHTFFAADLEKTLTEVQLSDEEAHHALHVLRLKKAAEIVLMNGRGLKAKARIEPLSKKKATARIIEFSDHDKPQPHITLCLGLIKTRQRLEWACEKLTEAGVGAIVLLDTERTERQKIRLDRLEGIVLSAAKQSLSAYIPQLSHSSLAACMAAFAKEDERTAFILAHEKNVKTSQGEARSLSFPAIREKLQTKGVEHIILFIGPEGGFSDKEVEHILSQSNALPLWLGSQRLRAETAAIQTAGLFRFAW